MTHTKKTKKITDTFSQGETPNLTNEELEYLNTDINSGETGVEINNDIELVEFNNHDEEPMVEDSFDFRKYEDIENAVNPLVDEGNFNDFCEPYQELKLENGFVTGVSTNVNLKTKNYLTDLVHSSKLVIRNKKLVEELYMKEGFLGLFKCFFREDFMKKILRWTNTNIILLHYEYK